MSNGWKKELEILWNISPKGCHVNVNLVWMNALRRTKQSNLVSRSDIEWQEATFTNWDSDDCWLRQMTS